MRRTARCWASDRSKNARSNAWALGGTQRDERAGVRRRHRRLRPRTAHVGIERLQGRAVMRPGDDQRRCETAQLRVCGAVLSWLCALQGDLLLVEHPGPRRPDGQRMAPPPRPRERPVR